MRRRAAFTALTLTCSLVSPLAAQSPAPEPPQPVTITEALVVGGVTRSRRTPIRIDPVEAALVRGTFVSPEEGASLALPGGQSTTWTKVVAGEDGFLRDERLRGGYAFVRIESDAPRVMMLEATAHSLVYVNGEPRAGDPYQYGLTLLPVDLVQGTNTLLFSASRGVLRARLLPVPEPASPSLERRDLTAPDLLIGAPIDTVAGVIVVNPTAKPLRGAIIRAVTNGAAPVESAVPEIPALGMVKAPVKLVAPAPTQPGAVSVSLGLLIPSPANGETAAPAVAVSTLDLSLRAVDDGSLRRETFVSSIDGSAQYFAIQPAAPDAGERPGLILSLHGASVEASGQAAVYQRKPWAHVVAPTNRRPFGFDWEDWGRLDAIEVLDIAKQRLATDPQRQWVTGHSMGGHGTWQLAVHFPDLFAAAGPSAGWISFPLGGPDTDPAHPVGAIFNRAALPSQTLRLRENLARLGVYVLHGEADDNVTVANARTMRGELAQFHSDFAYREQPGAGHWWGNECVDWPALTEFLRRRTLIPTSSRSPLIFVTASPSVNGTCDWATVDAQQAPFELSRIELNRDVAARRLWGSTVNVARLELNLTAAGFAPDAPLRVELDGTTLADVGWPGDGQLWLERADDGAWKSSTPPSPLQKSHLRGGPFKDAFRNRMVFVYGTVGTLEENAVQRAKARYDAEVFWYRGNGAVEVVPDSAFDPAAHPDRNVIVYGNAETNSAWNRLLRESPVQVHRGSVRIGDRTFAGDDLCCLFVRPRPDSATATVGAVSGSGLAGLRLCDRMPYFVSGVAFPDVTLIGADMLERGLDGVRAAGYFGNDWSVERGVFGFAPPPAPPTAAPAAAPPAPQPPLPATEVEPSAKETAPASGPAPSP